MKKALLSIFVVFGFCSLIIGTSFATNLHLEWDANSEINLAGYRVYQSDTAGGPYHQIGSDIPAGTETYDLGDVTDTNYWVVTAINTIGLESGYSNEVNSKPPAPPSGCALKIGQ